MIIYNESKGGSGVSIFQISEFGKEEKKIALFPPLPLSHSYSTAHWPKSPRKKGDLFFWTLYLSESKQALLYVS